MLQHWYNVDKPRDVHTHPGIVNAMGAILPKGLASALPVSSEFDLEYEEPTGLDLPGATSRVISAGIGASCITG